jgi:hypothetical protein
VEPLPQRLELGGDLPLNLEHLGQGPRRQAQAPVVIDLGQQLLGVGVRVPDEGAVRQHERLDIPQLAQHEPGAERLKPSGEVVGGHGCIVPEGAAAWRDDTRRSARPAQTRQAVDGRLHGAGGR